MSGGKGGIARAKGRGMLVQVIQGKDEETGRRVWITPSRRYR